MSTSNFADQTRTLTGDLAAVKTATETVHPKQLSDDDATHERRIDVDELPDEYQEALEADTFLLFGKASVQQYDKGNPRKGQPPQKLEIGALEDALGDYLTQGREGGPVTVGHQDVVVGHVLPSFELDEPTTFDVGDETLSFDAGDSLQTHVEEGDGQPEMWVVADLANDTYYARKMRVLTLAGVLDGFSVTIVSREWEDTDAGERVTALDWHSTTIGTGEQILNPDAEFGVATFKMAMSDAADGMAATFRETIRGAGDAGEQAAETPRQTNGMHDDIQNGIHDTITMGLFDAFSRETGINSTVMQAATEANQKAQTRDLSQKEAVTLTLDENDFDVSKDAVLGAMGDSNEDPDDPADEEPDSDNPDEDDVDPGAEAEAGDEVDSHADEGESSNESGEGNSSREEYEDDAQEAIANLAAALGVSADRVAQMVNQMADDETSDEEEDEDEDEPAPPDQHADDDEFVTEDDLDEKLDGLRGDIVDDLAPKLEGAVEDSIEDFGQKMATGGTSDPTGGPATTGRDFDAELDRIAEEKSGREA